MARAVWNGAVLAESAETIVVEGNHYFPAGAVRREYLRPSVTRTTCPWKGDCSCYTVEVGGERNPGAAWFYPAPKEAARHIAGYVAFWRGVEVDPAG